MPDTSPSQPGLQEVVNLVHINHVLIAAGGEEGVALGMGHFGAEGDERGCGLHDGPALDGVTRWKRSDTFASLLACVRRG